MTDTGFTRPSRTQIRDRILNDLKAGMDGVDAFLRRSFTYVYGVSISGLIHGMYGYLDWIARQVFPDTAEVENMERIGSFWKITRKAAVKATGTVTFQGVDDSHVGIGTKLQSGDGIAYETTAEGTISGGTLTLPIAAVEPGKAGNLGSNTSLIFISPIEGVQAVATSGIISGGTDTESDEDLQERVLTRMRKPPHGGADFDYVAWAKEVSGVTRAWAKNIGPGSVRVRFMMDDTYSDGIPQAGDVSNVLAYIQSVRPLGIKALSVMAPVPVSLNFSILLKDSDGNTVTDSTVRANVEAELRDLIRREAEPGKKMLLSKIREAISTAIGEYDHNITLPAGDVTYAAGEIAVMGAITWLP
jgi:uncharacterized phage protein gp47/JayE